MVRSFLTRLQTRSRLPGGVIRGGAGRLNRRAAALSQSPAIVLDCRLAGASQPESPYRGRAAGHSALPAIQDPGRFRLTSSQLRSDRQLEATTRIHGNGKQTLASADAAYGSATIALAGRKADSPASADSEVTRCIGGVWTEGSGSSGVRSGSPVPQDKRLRRFARTSAHWRPWALAIGDIRECGVSPPASSQVRTGL